MNRTRPLLQPRTDFLIIRETLIWARGWLAQTEPRLNRYGNKRLVRNILAAAGLVSFATDANIYQITLNAEDGFTKLLVESLVELLAPLKVGVILCKT